MRLIYFVNLLLKIQENEKLVLEFRILALVFRILKTNGG